MIFSLFLVLPGKHSQNLLAQSVSSKNVQFTFNARFYFSKGNMWPLFGFYMVFFLSTVFTGIFLLLSESIFGLHFIQLLSLYMDFTLKVKRWSEKPQSSAEVKDFLGLLFHSSILPCLFFLPKVGICSISFFSPGLQPCSLFSNNSCFCQVPL